MHRDIKLENIFLNKDYNVKIGDFGLADSINSSLERLYLELGTSSYMAPEIFTKNGYRFEIDVWSLGNVLFAMVCGYLPFKVFGKN